MPGTFPNLSTGKVAQYPLERTPAFGSELVRFLNMGEQVYLDRQTARRGWVLVYEDISDEEVRALLDHFESNQGRFGTFTFTDPYDSATITTCSFAEDEFRHTQTDEGRNQVKITIYEHP